MTLTSTNTAEIRIVTVNSDRIDAASAIRFKEEMRAQTADPPARVILNLAPVDFIDSSGLGAIVATMKQLQSGSRMDLAGLAPNVEKVFRLTRMDTVFALYPTLADALDGVAG